MLSLKVYDGEDTLLAVVHGENEVNLAVSREYREGDRLALEISGSGAYVWLQFDDALGASLCYVTGTVVYQIPFGEKRVNLSPKAFSGGRHLLKARLARGYEYGAYRNLAVNVNDLHTVENCFPHASANVETRGESVFAAQNAINGNTLNDGHGEWPYESWGINRDPEACFRLDFGRMVEIDMAVLYTRADFPHDNWWEQAEMAFCDGSSVVLEMTKSASPHVFPIEKKKTSWLTLSKLKQADDPSPFPALTQIEVYGTEAEIPV